MLAQFLRSLVVMVLCLVTMIAVWLPAAPAQALVKVKLSDLSYEECPDTIGRGAVDAGSSRAASCFIIHGTTQNESGKPVVNADIFGRIYDKNHNPAFPNRNRIGAIDYIQPGKGEFELQITVAANLSEPLQFEGFTASGFKGRVRR